MNWLREVFAMNRHEKNDAHDGREERSARVAQKAAAAVDQAETATSEWREQVRRADAALLRARR